MSITSTELKKNLSYYLSLSATEDIYITKNGKIISKLTNPLANKVENVKSLFGIIASEYEETDIKAERLRRQ